MAMNIHRTRSPRHNISYDLLPTKKGNIWGGSVVRYSPKEYGAILDCVYEMADMVSNSNSVSLDDAITLVLHDENWTILPRHRQLIIKLLEQK